MTKIGYKQTKKHRTNIKNGHIGIPSHRKSLTFEQEYGKQRAAEIKEKIAVYFRGEQNPSKRLEVAKKKSDAMLRNAQINPNFGMTGKKHTIKSKEKLSKIKEEWWKQHPEEKEKLRQLCYKRVGENNYWWKRRRPTHSKFMEEKWSDNEFKEKQLKKIYKGLSIRPTSYEKKIAELCIENSLPFIYTGDGRFLINFKNPDFVNQQDKIIIEVFYSWFKIKVYGSVENYKEHCKKKYNSSGWKIIFIDEDEVDVNNWKELCLNKIRKLNLKLRDI